MKSVSACAIVIVFAVASSGLADSSQPHPAAITLPQALARALEHNPLLAAYSADIRAADARATQAGLRPNPELSIEVEDMRLRRGPGKTTREVEFTGTPSLESIDVRRANDDGIISVPVRRIAPGLAYRSADEDGAATGLGEAEITLSISQLIELGGKRAKRIELAEREKEIVLWQYEATRADVLERTASAFIELLAAQERLAILDELIALAETVQDTVARQVKAGAVSPLEENKARLTLHTTRIERVRAEHERNAARVALSAMWAAPGPDFTAAAGSLDITYQLPTPDAIVHTLEKNPDIARWAAETRHREAAFALARAQRVPDPTVAVGVRLIGTEERGGGSYTIDGDGGLAWNRLKTSVDSEREATLYLAMSVPLPLFNRNQGAADAALHEMEGAAERRRAAYAEAVAQIHAAYESASAALREVEELAHTVLPVATESFDKTREGYRQGKFAYLDVLEAERTLFDARRRKIEAIAAFHHNVVRMERLTGLSIAENRPPSRHTPETKDASNE